MMNIRSIHSELGRYEDIVTELKAAIADPQNACIVTALRRHLDDANRHCEHLRRQIRQQHEAFINSINFEDGDTQPMIPVHVDTSAERHAEMRHIVRQWEVQNVLDTTDYDPPLLDADGGAE